MSAAVVIEDDLEYNPFYIALQENFLPTFQEAQKKCHIICIPHSHVLDGQIIDRAFVDTHILKPSPYFRGHYVSTDRANSKSLQLEDNKLKTAEGFPDERVIKILADEMGYNKEYKPYKILILDSTIWPPPKVLLPSPTDTQLGSLHFKPSLEEDTAYLKSWNSQALANLDRSIKLFNDNYMVLQKYLLDAASRLNEIWDSATLDFTRTSEDTDGRQVSHLTVAIESYIMSGVYDKVFPVICGARRRDEQLLQTKKPEMADIPSEKLGLASHLDCRQPAAVKEVDRLDSLKTPMEKLIFMKNTLDLISKTVNEHLNETRTLANKDTPCLASDDLLPLLVKVVSASKVQNLSAHIYHVENFHWSTSSTDDLSYALVTFKAAVQYISDTDVRQIKPQQEDVKKVVSENTPTNTTKPAVESSSAGTTAQTQDIKMSRFDRQLDRITKMLEESTKELVTSSIQHPPPPRSRPVTFDYASNGPMIPGSFRSSQPKKDNGLGEFLSSLKEDSWHSSYGKQT